MHLSQNQQIFFIMSGLFFLILFLTKKWEYALQIILRMAMGAIGIYLIGIFCKTQSLDIHIGINFFTMPMIGLLGVPGLLLLYGAAAYHLFLG